MPLALNGFESTRGEQSRNSRLTEEDVLQIRRSDWPVKKLAKKYSVSTYTIQDIRKRKRWGWLKDKQEDKGSESA